MALSPLSQSFLLVSRSSETCSHRQTSLLSLRFKARAQSISSLWACSSPGHTLKAGDRSFLSHSHGNKPLSVRVIAESETTSLIIEPAISDYSSEDEPEIGGGSGSGSGSDGGGGGGGGDGSSDNNNNDNDNSGGDQKGEGNSEKKMSMSQKLTLGYAALVGVGGVVGYAKSGSQKSLAFGGLFALLLCYVYTQLPVRPAFASSLGLGLSAALLAVMGSRFNKSRKVFPAGVVSLVSLVMTGGYLHGILRGMHA